MSKPYCPLIGENGNVYNLAGIVSITLKKNGQSKEAEEMLNRLYDCPSYDHALRLFAEYVEIGEASKYETEDRG
jgi:hypothetical protein